MRVESVVDAQDPRLADYQMVRDAPHRARGTFIVEGRLAVQHLLTSDRHATRSILTTPSALEGLGAALQPTCSAPILLASHDIIREVVGFKFHRGCLAVGERGAPRSPRELIEPAGARVVLVLESLVDPENVGAIFRNALAFGADAVLLTPDCGDPLGRKAIRASAGGALRVPFATVPGGPGPMAGLRASGYELLALSPRGTTPLDALGRMEPVGRRLAVLLGNEGGGLSAALLGAATRTVRIAMAPGVDSLNAATACAIALHYLAAGAAAP